MGNWRRHNVRLVLTAATVVVAGVLAPVALNAFGVTSSSSAGACDTTGQTVQACSTPTSSAGSITGTVTNSSGAFLAGICVNIYPGGGNLTNTNRATTTSTGSYVIGDLPAGSYDVEFSGGCGNTGSYAPQWFLAGTPTGTPTEAESSPVAVEVGQYTSLGDAEMGPGGSISGTVTNSASVGVGGVCVYAFPSGTENFYPPPPAGVFPPVAETTTASSGAYTVANLVASGSYDVYFNPTCGQSSVSGYQSQYYSSTVTPTPTATGIDATLALSVPPQPVYGNGTISGTVTNGSGSGVAGVCVYLYPHGIPNRLLYSMATTGSTGTYSVAGLAFGSYDVHFDPTCGGSTTSSYASGWYDGTSTPASSQSGATAVDITSSGLTASAIDATLPAVVTGTVSGTVTNSSGSAVSGVCVYLYDPGFTQPIFQTAASQVKTGSTGYSVTVPEGSYYVQFDPTCQGADASTTYAEQWYDGATSGAPIQAQATALHVASSGATAKAVLAGGGVISGTITLPTGSSSTVSVEVFQAGTPNEVSSVTVSGGGSYTVAGLPAGNNDNSYDVEFQPQGSSGSGMPFEPGWYSGSSCCALTESGATTVSVTAGATHNSIDGGFGDISGTVTASGNGLGGAFVELFPSGPSGAFASTGSTGGYDFGLVPDGSYKVQFSAYDQTTGSQYVTQWYNDASTQAAGTAVAVSGGTSKTGIGAAMVPGATISGEITNALGSGAFAVCVDVYTAGSSPSPQYQGYSFPGSSTTEDYSVSGLPTGSYDVEFDPTCAGADSSGYSPQYYDASSAPANPTSSSGATALTVSTAGQSLTGVDDQLPVSSTAPPAPPPGATSSASGSGTNPSATDGTVSVTTSGATSGTSAVTVAQYSSDPVGSATFSSNGQYFDVAISPGSSFTSLTVKECNVGSGTGMEWWTGSSWLAVSPVTGPASGCLTATLSSTSSPTLSQLSGTVFAVSVPSSSGGGGGGTPVSTTTTTTVPTTPTRSGSPAPSAGYWLVGADGGVFSFGQAGFHGSLAGMHLDAPIVGMAEDPATGGYWLVGSDGGVFSFDAPFYGSMGGQHLDAPIVGIAATPDGGGYWLVGSDGGVFSFGDARFFGSMGGKPLSAPVVGMASTPDGNGYWLVGSDGGVFTFGDAGFLGSMGSVRLAKPVVGMAEDPATGGYWLVGSDGGVFSFDAPFYGSAGGVALASPVVGMAAKPGGGYWLVTSAGDVLPYSAPALGGLGNVTLSAPIVGMSTAG